ncbi:MAG: 50S ribosomal protein L29 [Patescibacteria group bacterium]
MKYKEIKEKTTPDLEMMLRAQREKLRELRFKVSAKQLKNIREIRVLKKNIAQILTILRERKNKS